MISIRQLQGTDRIDVDVFLERHAETCMFMRSNIATAGLVYKGLRHQGEHYGAFKDGALVGVIGHYSNGHLMIEAQDGIADLAIAAAKGAARSGLQIRAILGAYDQVDTLIEALNLQKWPTAMHSKDRLLAMKLKDLKIPDLCHDPDFYMRDPTEHDRDLMMKWRYDYEMEFGVMTEGDDMQKRIAADVEEFMSNGKYWLFEYNEEPVAFSGFNAVTDDTVQPSVVWVPPTHRSKGFASPIVASILKLARDRWNKNKTVIFSQNEAAEKAYKALGYRDFGHYAIAIFKKPYMPKM